MYIIFVIYDVWFVIRVSVEVVLLVAVVWLFVVFLQCACLAGWLGDSCCLEVFDSVGNDEMVKALFEI